MRRAAILLTVFLALPAATSAKARIEKRTVLSDGKERTYYLYVPERPAGAAPMPLLVTLHGSGRNGETLVEKWKKAADKEGIVLAGPDATNRENWNTASDGPVLLHDLVEELRAKLPIDARRIYLFGHSAGAVLALFMASLESEYFAAVAAHAGALQVQHHSVFGYATRKTPILLIVGSWDLLFPVPTVEATRDALVASGFPVELEEIPNHTHDYYRRSGEINGRVWSFLSRHALAQQPKYIPYGR